MQLATIAFCNIFSSIFNRKKVHSNSLALCDVSEMDLIQFEGKFASGRAAH